MEAIKFKVHEKKNACNTTKKQYTSQLKNQKGKYKTGACYKKKCWVHLNNQEKKEYRKIKGV